MAVFVRQAASSVLMMRPAAFGMNPDTAESNPFQCQVAPVDAEAVSSAALRDFDEAVELLRQAEIDVHVYVDDPTPPKPDAVFPNNWLSFHEDGRAALYPLFSPSRRPERRLEILEAIRRSFHLREALDYTFLEDRGLYLEGTGSLVLDRIHRVAYACRSPRTSPEALDLFCRDFGYRPHVFQAVDGNEVPIYHTNVMMAVGTKFATVCLESVPDESERAALLGSLRSSGRHAIEIGLSQMESFAGNMLELANRHGEPVITMSCQALDCLRGEQLALLEDLGKIVALPIDTIETYGGGSARCMICEIFLDPRS